MSDSEKEDRVEAEISEQLQQVVRGELDREEIAELEHRIEFARRYNKA